MVEVRWPGSAVTSKLSGNDLRTQALLQSPTKGSALHDSDDVFVVGRFFRHHHSGRDTQAALAFVLRRRRSGGATYDRSQMRSHSFTWQIVYSMNQPWL